MADIETPARIHRRPPTATAPSPDDLIDLEEVMAKTHLGGSTIYKKMARGEFPLAVQLSTRCVRWVLGEVEEFNRVAKERRVVLRAPMPRSEAAAAGEEDGVHSAPRRSRGRPRRL